MGFIPAEVISQVLDRSDIVAAISAYVPVKRAGRNFKALCPFHHEKTPSFVINPDKQIFHCFGCGVGGNVISFVMQQERLEFPEAVRFLADKAGVVIPEASGGGQQSSEIRKQLFDINAAVVQYFHQNLLADRSPAAEGAREYLKKRGVTLDIVKKFQLGFALDQWDGLIQVLRQQGISLALMEKAGLIIPQSKGDGYYDRFRNRVIFPIFDLKNQCVAFGARALDAENPAKYINSPETVVYTKGQHLYGFQLSRDAAVKEDSVIVVEGYMDFIMPFQLGVTNIAASLGTALTTDQIRLLRRYTENVIMLFDSDQAGEAAMIRSLDLLIEAGMNVRVVSLTKEDDPDSFIRKYGLEQFRQRVGQAQSLFDFKLNILRQKHDVTTIEGRAKVSSEMLPTIGKIPNEIVKSEYVKRLSQILSLSQDALFSEMRKSQGKGATAAVPQPTRTPVSAQPPVLHPAERDLLRLMLHENEFVALTRAQIDVADFQSEQVRLIVAKIFELCDQGQEASAATLAEFLDDQRVLQIISGLLVSEEILIGDKQRMHRDCVDRLKQDQKKKQRKLILEQMQVARASGDVERLEELTQQFNQLIKG